MTADTLAEIHRRANSAKKRRLRRDFFRATLALVLITGFLVAVAILAPPPKDLPELATAVLMYAIMIGALAVRSLRALLAWLLAAPGPPAEPEHLRRTAPLL